MTVVNKFEVRFRSCLRQARAALRLAGTLSLVGVVLFSHPAFADYSSGAVTSVRYVNESGNQFPQLIIQFSGSSTNYYAQQPSPRGSVPAASLDTIKIWQSLATAAMLSGRTLRIDYITYNTYRYIYDVQIQTP